MKMKIKRIKFNHSNNSDINNNDNKNKSAFAGTNTRVILDSIVKLNPRYLAKDNPVMFTVELGFIVVLAIGLLPTNGISSEICN